MPPRLLVFAGSTRSGALSHKTALAVARILGDEGGIVTVITLEDYPMPIYNGDDEAESGIPEGAMRLGRLMAQQDGFVICSPEYNASIPALLKNTLDWVSRIKTDGDKPLAPFKDKVAAICGSSNGKLGGIRMLPHLRQVLQNLGLLVLSEQVAVGNADKAFDPDGQPSDPALKTMMTTMARQLLYRAKDSRHDL